MDGYRVIKTVYEFVPTLHEAKRKALLGRSLGVRTEIITEDDYQQNHNYKPFQDLTTIEVELGSQKLNPEDTPTNRVTNLVMEYALKYDLTYDEALEVFRDALTVP